MVSERVGFSQFGPRFGPRRDSSRTDSRPDHTPVHDSQQAMRARLTIPAPWRHLLIVSSTIAAVTSGAAPTTGAESVHSRVTLQPISQKHTGSIMASGMVAPSQARVALMVHRQAGGKPASTRHLVTRGKAGTWAIKFQLTAGSYRVQASSRDKRGHVTRSQQLTLVVRTAH